MKKPSQPPQPKQKSYYDDDFFWEKLPASAKPLEKKQVKKINGPSRFAVPVEKKTKQALRTESRNVRLIGQPASQTKKSSIPPHILVPPTQFSLEKPPDLQKKGSKVTQHRGFPTVIKGGWTRSEKAKSVIQETDEQFDIDDTAKLIDDKADAYFKYVCDHCGSYKYYPRDANEECKTCNGGRMVLAVKEKNVSAGDLVTTAGSYI